MAKKSRTAKIKTPIFEYSWYKEINQPETNKEFIQSKINDFILLIENQESVNIRDMRVEFIEFTKLVPAQGHLSKLDKEYQGKFLKITKFVKERFKPFFGAVSG